jgi:hypothetical protein
VHIPGVSAGAFKDDVMADYLKEIFQGSKSLYFGDITVEVATSIDND